jgi:hypothetical protein
VAAVDKLSGHGLAHVADTEVTNAHAPLRVDGAVRSTCFKPAASATGSQTLCDHEAEKPGARIARAVAYQQRFTALQAGEVDLLSNNSTWTLVRDTALGLDFVGITSKNVDEMLKSDNPAIKRILGVTPSMGKALGVDEKWVYTIIKQVGNYGESFDRNVGKDSPLKVERGQNALWTKGGLHCAPSIR